MKQLFHTAKDFFLNVLSKEACGLELLPDVFSYGHWYEDLVGKCFWAIPGPSESQRYQ